ncbi:uncharacterized protein GIQ15_06230 [Arthroderma uncinatum]|uniref:uncharacterized protein n=1 Tax=Arthroderma uncinatum TaxID=74035 RepID=UPI00144AD4D5|nr:uncharacterized protein GIQ15_06230 [Arthroderma uncinatum]KAF3480883.1 hypothetical protein GIQ15_06230 [Arthroderma uncinatum]
MQLLAALQLGLLALATPGLCASSGWGFADGTLSIQQKGAGIGGGQKQKLSENKPLAKPVTLNDAGTLKLLLTIQDDRAAMKPHQAFLMLKESETGLDISYPLSVKGNGKALVELNHKDLPVQLLAAKTPIEASLLIASFGASNGYNKPIFKLAIDRNPDDPLPSSHALRYGKLEEIHHIFKSDPRSPPVIISLIFTLAVLATLPLLAISWFYLGANANHLSVALKSSPLPHVVFVGSIIGLELTFFMYYTSWNLFQTLPVAAAIGVVAVLSGSRALGENTSTYTLRYTPMGTSASKPARAAATAASRRQYPLRPSPSTTSTPARPQPAAAAEKDTQKQGPVYHSQEKASATRSEAIDLDARDPDFDASLRSIGPVTPTPTLSRTSIFNQGRQQGASSPSGPNRADTANPSLLTLSSRTRISAEAEADFESLGRRDHMGRRFVDVVSLKQILSMRDEQGVSEDVIEKQFGLRKGVLATLGPKGVVAGVR